MLLYKSKDGNSVTVVVKDREVTMSMAEWSALIARPTVRLSESKEVAVKA